MILTAHDVALIEKLAAAGIITKDEATAMLGLDSTLRAKFGDFMNMTLDLKDDRRREHIFNRLKHELKKINGDELASVGCPVSPDNSLNPIQDIFEWFCNHKDPDFAMDVILSMRTK